MTSLSTHLASGVLAIVLAGAAFAAPGPQPAKVATPQAAAPSAAASDAAAISSSFWGEVKTTTSSGEFASLKAAVGCATKSAAAPSASGAPARQRVVDLAIANPAEAAKIMTDATAASGDPAAARALSTVVNMVVPPTTLDAATALVPPEAQTRVTEMRANLTTGIPGLPGLYLGDVEHASNGAADPAAASFGDGRGSAPAGYEPVAGGSMGCPVR